MLLVLDVGNTNVKIGLWKEDELFASWRLSTITSRTSDEFGVQVVDLLATKGVLTSDVEGVIMSSVAPSMNYTMEHMCGYYLGKKPILVSPKLDTGLTVKYRHPEQLGSDRLVDSVAAYYLYGGPVIVVDFGTATTFNAISESGEYLGGAIAPGIKTATDSLVNAAAKLPRIELVKAKNVIGKTTVENMQAGISYGFAGLTEYIVKKMKQEEGMENTKVVATGGLSEIVSSVDGKIIDVTDRALALKGLKILYDRNKKC